VPDPDYVLTLDADSVLLPEYCLRLVHLMEQPGQERTAVAQTPYSAYPGSTTRIERLAGATTDLQHIVHQGLTHYNATFWVGANAVLRKAALDDIVEVDDRGAHPVRRFIQDRTVIEDTESSVDLGARGWKLVNYPERLSYSATPPDFGSLSIQRQRWANGGLLIMSKLWRSLRRRRHQGERMGMGEAFLRVNYMASICWASFGLAVLLIYPYTNRLLSPLVLVTALPYFLAMAADLARCGYRRLDVLRIYGFNLVLLPVNLSGVMKSIGQALTGRKIPFARTPKIRNRTTAQLTFVLTPYLLVAWSGFTFVGDIQATRWAHAAFAGANALLATYAIVAYIGIRHSVEDVWMNLVSRLYRPEPALAPAATASMDELDWESVLYLGDTGTASSVLSTVRSGNGRPKTERPRKGALS
ncbi:MAG TPA: glycosyltransferase family 2 protein, partial [Actinomycetota bacterium]